MLCNKTFKKVKSVSGAVEAFYSRLKLTQKAGRHLNCHLTGGKSRVFVGNIQAFFLLTFIYTNLRNFYWRETNYGFVLDNLLNVSVYVHIPSTAESI